MTGLHAGAGDADRPRDSVALGARRIVGVEATGINASPCAQGLVRDQAAERLGEAGFEQADVARILELVPLATHNQRGRGTLYLGTDLRLDAEDLVELVELDELPGVRAPEAPRRALRRRARPPLAVLRRGLRAARGQGRIEAYGDLDDENFVLARQVNFETIHNHDVLAERFGTVGEALRSELANGGHSARHTEPATGSAPLTFK